jgi:competence protein ComEC
LLIEPESLLGASFQLSFAAVMALIAVYEGPGTRALASLAPKDGDAPKGARWMRISTTYVAGILLTTLVASCATAPLLVYHFNRFATYSLVANLAGVPLTAIWIMPWSLLAFVLMPVGLEHLALVPMGWGVTALNWVAKTASGWPGAVVTIQAMPSLSSPPAAFGCASGSGRGAWPGFP